MTDAVLVRDDGAVRVISLNRPQRLNAINGDLVRALDAALAAADSDANVRAILLTGEGRAFCAGDDLPEQIEITKAGPERLVAQLEALQVITRRLMLGNKSVVGAFHGWAIGAGFSWALNCDLGLWAEGTRGYLPEVPFGMFVTGGLSFLLPRLVGPMIARELLLLGRRIDADELHRRGAALRVVPAEKLQEEALAVAHQLAALPNVAAAEVRRVFAQADRAALLDALRAESEACLATLRDPEAVARMQSFLKQKSA
jgi:enoyl-CoA hydratase/carnithine racemase